MTENKKLFTLKPTFVGDQMDTQTTIHDFHATPTYNDPEVVAKCLDNLMALIANLSFETTIQPTS